MSIKKRLDELENLLRPLEELSTTRDDSGASELQRALAEYMTSGSTFDQRDEQYAARVRQAVTDAKQVALDAQRQG